MSKEGLKRNVGYRAAELVKSGQKLGLGTGSTVYFYLERLGERIRTEKLDVVGVPTSVQTMEQAMGFDIPLATLDEIQEFDLYVDGADEIDGQFRMIKGGGGALLREKIIASCSNQKVIIVDEGKVVSRLGSGFALPVEVVPFGRRVCENRLQKLGCTPLLRTADGSPFVTNNGNHILDCRFEAGIEAPERMEAAINDIPGVVCCGLFIGLADHVLVGKNDGSVEERTRG